MPTVNDNATATPPDSERDTAGPGVTAPPDATEIHDWLQRGAGLPTRAFDGTVREAVGFTVRVGGLQRSNGTCKRWVTVEAPARFGVPLQPEAVRQLAAALTAAAYEIEARP
ncbi:hypothetical protein [Mycobacterium servetii]|uniref:Uncharacterized protein n=1 Tax=Mycobacterium servetii TaxID=3237418 RepID=A0ABV4BUX5_9MYCO